MNDLPAGAPVALTPEAVFERVRTALPSARVELERAASASGQHALRVHREDAREVAVFLRDDPILSLDFASNVTGVDYPGWLEAVYHLYSVTPNAAHEVAPAPGQTHLKESSSLKESSLQGSSPVTSAVLGGSSLPAAHGFEAGASADSVRYRAGAL